MARKVILDKYYTFNNVTRQIVIPRAIPKERLVLITDVTTNQVIYNFSDPNLLSTNYQIATSPDGSVTSTTITLNYNTTNLSNTDSLQIIIDEYDEKFTPSESYLDPINKLRVSTPQSLIDTDYEYSIQTTKWEQLSLLNNRPYAYYVTATNNLNPVDLQAVNNSRVYTLNVGSYPVTTLPIGSPIAVIDSTYAGADGVYSIDSNTQVAGANTVTYTGKYFYTGPSGSVFNPGVTIAYNANTFSNAAITIASATTSATGNVVTVSTTQPHGLAIGNEISFTGANTANGSWIVSTVISPNTFQFITTGTTTYVSPGTVTTTNASLYVRPQGLTVHRPFDGGVRFSTNSASHNQQYIRQTRRYFRYQSGKGIQMSTGTVLKPQFNLDSISYSASNNVVTVVSKDPHNIWASMQVIITGCNEVGYNGVQTISNVLDPYRFQYIPSVTPNNIIASGNYYASANSWYGGTNRIGIFDSQNGMFWEFDGLQLSAVRRSSTYQIGGQVAVVPGSALVTAASGYPTFFNKQLTVGDFIVIKGMSYRINNILSDTQLHIQPPYRGISSSNNAVISKTIDLRIPSSSFNIDRLDGTGPSGYNIDLTKMQMFYIDYSWYGAGFIRWGVRGPAGDVIYAHKMINNNVNYLAYMRSGNLPGRYETNTFSKTTFMTGGAGGLGTNFNSTDTVLFANNISSGWPTSGTLFVRNANTGGLNYANSEYITYTGISGNSFTGIIRGQAGNSAIYGTTVTGNNTITLSAANSTVGIQIGQYVFGPNVPAQSFVQSFIPNTSITLNQCAIGNTIASPFQFAPMSNTAQTFIFSTTAQTAIELHTPQFSPEINHWGTSAIMDGGFTPDKSFIFTKGMTNTVSVGQGSSQAIMSFRISPSASNGVAAGQLGQREIINRMQQLPFEVDMYANGSFLVTCYLNARTTNANEIWQSVGGSSLSQYIFHNTGTQVVANTGEPVFGFYLNTQQGTYQTTQQDLTQLLALGNSILGGGNANAASGIYPDGPDVLTFSVQNIDTASRNVQARYSWNEAQA
jgi:hypothetical protein